MIDPGSFANLTSKFEAAPRFSMAKLPVLPILGNSLAHFQQNQMVLIAAYHSFPLVGPSRSCSLVAHGQYGEQRHQAGQISSAERGERVRQIQ